MVVKEKITEIAIDDKVIPLKFSSITLKIFKKTFKKELMDVVNSETGRKNVDVKGTTKHILQVMWAFEKTANPKIQRFNRWKKQFDTMNPEEVLDIFEDLSNQIREVIDNDATSYISGIDITRPKL